MATGLLLGTLVFSSVSAAQTAVNSSRSRVAVLTSTPFPPIASDWLKVSGVISDQNGGVIPGATVTLTNTKTGDNRSTISNSEGRFEFADVAIGDYDILIEAMYFKKVVIANLRVEQDVTFEQKLEVADDTLIMGLLVVLPEPIRRGDLILSNTEVQSRPLERKNDKPKKKKRKLPKQN